jgi:putative flippase GtrA
MRKPLTSHSELLGQGVRFIVAGGVVALLYLTTTLVLADVFQTPFQAALAIGFCVGLICQFTLQRVFVWTQHRDFALPAHQQAARYLSIAAMQYGVTAGSTSLLPSALGVRSEIVYVVTVAVVSAANFLVFRNGVFHTKPAAVDSSAPTPGTGG